MHSSRQAPTRLTWLIIFGGLVCSVFAYGLLCFLIDISHESKPRALNAASLTAIRPILVVAAVVTLVAAVAWLRFRVDGKIGGEGREVVLSAAEFQTDSIVALALSESCAILGLLLFFLGAPLKEFALFALGTLIVDFAFILPRGLQFWATRDNRGSF